MNKKRLVYLTALTFCMTFNSCKENEEIRNFPSGEKKPAVFASTRTDEEDIVTPTNGITEILEDEFIDGYSWIYISQRGNNLDPNFDTPNSNNLYTYSYYENPAATWDNGYNFAPVGDKELDWNNIQEIGQIGNGYIFFSMYFPQDNHVRFNVESDQSEIENLRKSNVLGARHTTDAIDSRLRFRFYHLMAFLNVSLYVPIYDETNNSGFLDNALEEGTVLDINRFFRINYSANVGSDASPSVELLQDSPLDNIKMFIYPETEETEINVKDYYPASEIETDKVRKYTLSMILPAGQNLQNGDFLRFQLHTPGGTVKKYTFSTNIQSVNLQILKGNVTQLGLYLPRKENNTILINAEILDWNHCSSEMNLVEETFINN